MNLWVFWGESHKLHPSWVTQKYVSYVNIRRSWPGVWMRPWTRLALRCAGRQPGVEGVNDYPTCQLHPVQHLEKLKELPLWEFKYSMGDAKIEPTGWKVFATNKSGDEFSDNLISQLILPSMTWQVIPWCMKSSCYDWHGILWFDQIWGRWLCHQRQLGELPGAPGMLQKGGTLGRPWGFKGTTTYCLTVYTWLRRRVTVQP